MRHLNSARLLHHVAMENVSKKKREKNAGLYFWRTPLGYFMATTILIGGRPNLSAYLLNEFYFFFTGLPPNLFICGVNKLNIKPIA